MVVNDFRKKDMYNSSRRSLVTAKPTKGQGYRHKHTGKGRVPLQELTIESSWFDFCQHQNQLQRGGVVALLGQKVAWSIV